MQQNITSQDEQKSSNAGQKSSNAGQNKIKLSRGKLIALIIVSVIIWFLAVQMVAADKYSAVVNVIEGENKVGVNPLADKLDFGDLSRDNGASRFITLKNPGGLFYQRGERYIM